MTVVIPSVTVCVTPLDRIASISAMRAELSGTVSVSLAVTFDGGEL